MPGPGTWLPGDVLTAEDLNAIGVWTSYTPTLTQGVARTATINYAEYCVINKMCMVNVDLTCTTTGSVAALTVSLPINAAGSSSSAFFAIGSGILYDISATDVILTSVYRASSSTVGFYSDAASTELWNTSLGNGDVISFSAIYETV